MGKFVTITGNKITAIRYAEEIVEGEFLAENDLENAELGDVFIDGTWQKDPQEIAEAEKQARIKELKETIANKKLLDMDCTEEQTELKNLLGM